MNQIDMFILGGYKRAPNVYIHPVAIEARSLCAKSTDGEWTGERLVFLPNEEAALGRFLEAIPDHIVTMTM